MFFFYLCYVSVGDQHWFYVIHPLSHSYAYVIGIHVHLFSSNFANSLLIDKKLLPR